MTIKGKVHCFFEQSGTFKNEFRKLGILAEDYDIQNSFGETDHVIDLFREIENAFDCTPSVFDEIGKDDLIISFFPCIEFSCVSQMWFSLGQCDYNKWPYRKRIDYMLEKIKRRSFMFQLLYKFCGTCLDRSIRMVLENPWGMNTYLKQNVFLKKPSVIDFDRSARGDFRSKPTAYWFFNCSPSRCQSYQRIPKCLVKNHNQLKKAPRAGLCSQERSMISSVYARNFICDNILGIPISKLVYQQIDLFD